MTSEETLNRYATISAYMNNQTDEEWLRLRSFVLGKDPTIVAVGTPFNGLELFGPFACEDDAVDWAAPRDLGGEPWTIVSLQ